MDEDYAKGLLYCGFLGLFADSGSDSCRGHVKPNRMREMLSRVVVPRHGDPRRGSITALLALYPGQLVPVLGDLSLLTPLLMMARLIFTDLV